MTRRLLLTLTVTLTAAVMFAAGPLWAENPQAAKQAPRKTAQAWTFNEAMRQLSLNPDDVYLQYVALQLGRNEGKVDQPAALIQNREQRRGRRRDRERRVDLFALFTGALAVQECLQLDTMRGDRNAVGSIMADPAKNVVAIADLEGPTVKSHPWGKMLAAQHLAGKRAEHSPLARCVPEDQYFVLFRSPNKLLEAADMGDLWGAHLFAQATKSAKSHRTTERLKRQLAIQTDLLTRPFYDMVVDEVAMTGSDLYFTEGSDVTLLFRVKQPEVFRARMDGFLSAAEKSRDDAVRSIGKIEGIDYVQIATPDRAIHVFSAYPKPNLHVRSNSKVGLRRVLQTIAGTGEVKRLADATEFKYIRTLMQRGDKREDGFVYLSDPFIRRLVGPQMKLCERRRMICYNHLRMIGHAAMLYCTQYGTRPETIEQLVAAECLPERFGETKSRCPCGGEYTLSTDGTSATCSHHGPADQLIPCSEIPLQRVTEREAKEYKQFVERYSHYWQRFFDPIAIRIQLTPEQYRAETIILPLIDNSVYTVLATVLGGEPEPLDALPVPKRNIFSIAARLNKKALLREAGLEHLLDSPTDGHKRQAVVKAYQIATRLKLLGLAMHGYHDRHKRFPTMVSFDNQGKKTRLSWRVHLLPYLEEPHLYREFHLDEPWNSEHNKKLIARMPTIFRPENPRLAAAGKTRFVAPIGENTIFPLKKKRIGLRDIRDGASNTIMLVEADDEHAVIWTKPDDLEINLKKPLDGLAIRPPGAFLAVFADGSVRFYRKEIDKDTLGALFTRSGKERIVVRSDEQVVMPGSKHWGVSEETLVKLGVGEFLAKGIGNQISMHVYDASPMFDFNLTGFLGEMLGNFRGRRVFGDNMIPISFLIASLNAPVYVAVPVENAEVVDKFLDQLDASLAELARHDDRGGWFGTDFDFYRVPLETKGDRVRCYSVAFGPVKWRVFFARIDDALYVASKRFILDDLAAAAKAKKTGDKPDDGPTAHAMLRVRPEHWDKVLPAFRLGWAETSREACLNNLGPLSSVARAMAASTGGKVDAKQVHREADRLHAVHFFCPDGGRYELSPDGKQAVCSVHGTVGEPKQLPAPAPNSPMGRLMKDFSGLTAQLIFLDDGLHAVVTVKRK